jgi:hypothetical protein
MDLARVELEEKTPEELERSRIVTAIAQDPALIKTDTPL